MLTLSEKRELYALSFELEWIAKHIPTTNRLIKISGKYKIAECPHCIEFFGKLKKV